MNRLIEWWNYSRYRRLSDDDAWLQMLLDSVHGRSRLPMPSFPTEKLQSDFIGSSNEDAINAAWDFYSLMSSRWREYGLRVGRRSYVLDFGCGWGRFARMFLRDVPASHIYCADTGDLALNACRETGVPGKIVRLEPMPPSPLPSAQFDVAFAYSVFSHLSPKAHLAWRTELARVMKPNGLVFITTHPRWFLDLCRQYREHPDQISHPWHQKLAKSFVDYEASVSKYDHGEFLFEADEPSSEFYGDAFVPSQYFEWQWSYEVGFELLEFVADQSLCQQAVAIVRKKA